MRAGFWPRRSTECCGAVVAACGMIAIALGSLPNAATAQEEAVAEEEAWEAPSFKKEAKGAARRVKKVTWSEVGSMSRELRAKSEPEQVAVGLSMLAEGVRRLRKEIEIRDDANDDMQSYFEKKIADAYWVGSKELAEYRKRLEASTTACDDVNAGHSTLTALSAQVQQAMAAMPDHAASREWISEHFRRSNTQAQRDDGRVYLVESLAPVGVRTMTDELLRAGARANDRDYAVAALLAVARAGEPIDLEALAPSLEHRDSFVRRASFRVLAADRTKSAVDAMVAQTEREHGVPLKDLVTQLKSVSGEKFGPNAQAWREWWETAGPGWSRPDELHEPEETESATGNTTYFGVALDSTRVAFIVDRSGSMDWRMNMREGMLTSEADRSLPRKIEAARKELGKTLSQLDENCWFSIITFATEVSSYSKRLVRATTKERQSAREYLARIRTDGVTNWSGGVMAGLDATDRSTALRDDDFADTLVVLCDGEPNCGPFIRTRDVLTEVQRRNRFGMIRIHTVFLGVDGDTKFLRDLAEQNGGQFVHRAK